ncbi:multicomponent Na+:H+ antiporter subunit G [Clostridiales Family XIII bacterium PM5-7]
MIREIIAAGFLLIGFLFLALSAIGIIRLPDFYSRMHASAIGETLGMALMGIGFIVYTGINDTAVKIMFICISIFIVNPIGIHLISKAAKSSEIDGKEKQDADIRH